MMIFFGHAIIIFIFIFSEPIDLELCPSFTDALYMFGFLFEARLRGTCPSICTCIQNTETTIFEVR